MSYNKLVYIKDWVKELNLSHEVKYLYCITNSLSPEFIKGNFYKIIKRNGNFIIKGTDYRLTGIVDIDNKFIAIIGYPTNLKMRDKFLIKLLDK